MKLTVSHRIVTRFDPPRRRLLQSLRLYPTACASQKVLTWNVAVSEGVMGADFTDGVGDRTVTVSIPGETGEVVLTITGEVQTFDTLGVLRDLKEKISPVAYLTSTRLIRADGAVAQLAREALAGIDKTKALDRAHALANAVTGALTRTREHPAEMLTAAEVLAEGKGDQTAFAHVLIAAAHAAEMPARFVYGYFHKNAAELDVETRDSGALVTAPWSAHAWAEIWIEGMGWVGFDAVEECCPDEAYIRLCSGRDGLDAAPVRGVAMGMGAETCQVALDVTGAEQ